MWAGVLEGIDLRVGDYRVPEDYPYGEVVSLLGKSGGRWGSRDYENLLFIIKLFQLDELALCMLYTLSRISNFRMEEKK
jgi:hypothetical protein